MPDVLKSISLLSSDRVSMENTEIKSQDRERLLKEMNQHKAYELDDILHFLPKEHEEI